MTSRRALRGISPFWASRSRRQPTGTSASFSTPTVLLCLHAWGAHGHPTLTSPDHVTPGNGLLLFFRVDDFDQALQRARALVARFDEEPHLNPNTRTMEFSVRDPDGYYVTISAL
jgi:catechol 2,3-dioxygenase-like lactoylglutathione lyase family enzyme